MAQPDIAFVRPELELVLDKYKVIRDCLEQRVKDEGVLYLPRPNPEDLSRENSLRFNSYLQRAIFYDVTSRTLNGLVGQIYANDPVVELPSQLKTMLEDANGNGVTLIQNSKEASRFVTAYGRCGLYTDYPVMEKDISGQPRPTTVAQLESGEIKPTISVYAAENIINWQKIRKGAKHIYSLVVLAQKQQVQVDDFKYEEQQTYKALRLGFNQATQKYSYYIEIWRPIDNRRVAAGAIELPTGEKVGTDDPGNGNDLWIVERLDPLDAKGQPLEEIPFEFIGAENNDSDVDAAPLYTMAELNIGHYRNSADYEEACFIVGQPTYVVNGLTSQWYKETLKGKLEIGSRGGIPLPVGADAKILQVEPNTMAREAMEHKEKQMAAIGAKLVEQKEVQQTATEANINSSADNSALADIAKNVSAAFKAALGHALKFTGGDGTIEFKLNTDFAINRMSAQDRAQLISEWTQGAVTWTELRRGLRESGVAFEDDTAAQTAIDNDVAKKADQAAEAAGKLAKAAPPAQKAFA